VVYQLLCFAHTVGIVGYIVFRELKFDYKKTETEIRNAAFKVAASLSQGCWEEAGTSCGDT